jgi:hypothetical protein
MSVKSTVTSTEQLAFRYRAADTPTGVTRSTAKRLAEKMGVDETQVIHFALRALAAKVLPQYELDDGPLMPEQLAEIRRRVPQGALRSVSSSLFDDREV